MMASSRWAPTALAASCVLAVTLPLLTLFTPSDWLVPTSYGVFAVALCGGILRRWSSRPGVVVVGQAVALTIIVHLTFLRGDGWHGLPSRDSMQEAAGLAVQAWTSISTHGAPVPLVPGISFVLMALVGLCAILVDHIAVGRRAPAAAGLPLLAAYLASASNSGSGLRVSYFVIPAAAYLALLGEDGLSRMRRWGGSGLSPLAVSSADPTNSFARAGRIMGGLALVVAVAIPGILPQTDPVFLASGLGRGGGGSTGVALNSTLDIAQSLSDPSNEPVLQYTATGSVGPLRIDILKGYANGRWSNRPSAWVPLGAALPPPSPVLTAHSRPAEMTVLANRVQAPQVALPLDPVRLRPEASVWQRDDTGTVRATEQVASYEVDYLEPALTAQQFSPQPVANPDPADLSLDDRAADRLRSLADEIIPVQATPLEAAWAIQHYLRSGRFSYSLELAPPTKDPSGGRSDGALNQFLITRSGYCVQFATAMIMLARAHGIPARMAIGYLPGSYDNGAYRVKAADAHAWPELLFPGLGWVRFEPTPSARSGTAPAWSMRPTIAPEPAPNSSAVTSPQRDPAQERPDTDLGSVPVVPDQTTTTQLIVWLATNWVGLALAGIVLCAAALLPLGSRLASIRARRRSLDDAAIVEEQWQLLLDQLADLGMPVPDSATPRQTAALVTSTAMLGQEDSNALSRVIGTLERARYAKPDGAPADLGPDAASVHRAVARMRSRRARMSAALWPRAGRRYWRDRWRSLTARLGRPPRDG